LGIRKVMDEASLQDYHSKIQVPYIIQSFVDFEIELGVFYYRFPNRPSGKVSSVVQKKFLSVTGDGESTLRELIMGYPRARFRIGYLEEKFKTEIDAVLPAGKVLELEGIGNHVRGTTFLNVNYLINKELNDVFDRISLAIDGFYFGRFDLRCRSLTDLYQGKNIQIMELNGAGAEPAHIYQPGFSFWDGQRVLLSHWKVLFQISQINMANGVKPLTFRQAKAEMKKHALALKSIGV
ncbi:MAG: hypothetical protein K2Q22_01390, partial [Cytophagales bacterium]|nr:hypothetical protein [Cytophagales bacterium]